MSQLKVECQERALFAEARWWEEANSMFKELKGQYDQSKDCQGIGEKDVDKHWRGSQRPGHLGLCKAEL